MGKEFLHHHFTYVRHVDFKANKSKDQGASQMTDFRAICHTIVW